MKYLKSEHLKFRRTFFNKLLIIAPLITAVFKSIRYALMVLEFNFCTVSHVLRYSDIKFDN